jgi:activator of HSP90 ATPase
MTAPSAMLMQSPHRDVLEATPDTEESKARLLEELQSRGRAAVGAKSWMDAKMLYEKALTVCVDSNRLAVLNSNLSLVEKNMGMFDLARKAAEDATQNDPTYVKGWWRLGQALISLKRSEDALEALNKAKFLDPTNKALIKEVEKVQKQVEEEKALMMETEEIAAAAATAATESSSSTPATKSKTTSTTTTTTTTTTSSSKPKKESSKDTAAMDVDKDDDDDDAKLFTKSEPVRGYKVVNGKKTSYFHNELDEKAKALIGDIAPKKLDNPPQPVNTSSATAGTSAWNQAGTWEEKDCSRWAKETLTKAIMETTFTFPESSPAPNALVTVTKVSKLDGHASVAVVRGKTRFIYEYSCKLEWHLGKSDDELECTGSLCVPDIDGTIALGEGYEIHDFVTDSVSDNSIKPLIDRFIHRGGFHEALNESIDDWVRLFRKEYGAKDA